MNPVILNKNNFFGIGGLLEVFDPVFRIFTSGHLHIGIGLWFILKNLLNRSSRQKYWTW